MNRPPPRQSQAAAFPSKPKAATPATRGGARQATTGGSSRTGGKVTLRANHFRLNLGENVYVFQYALRVIPDEVFDAALVHEILEKKNRHLFKLLGAYVPSGRMIFTMAQIEEDVSIETTYKSKPCQIVIEKSTET